MDINDVEDVFLKTCINIVKFAMCKQIHCICRYMTIDKLTCIKELLSTNNTSKLTGMIRELKIIKEDKGDKEICIELKIPYSVIPLSSTFTMKYFLENYEQKINTATIFIDQHIEKLEAKEKERLKILNSEEFKLYKKLKNKYFYIEDECRAVY